MFTFLSGVEKGEKWLYSLADYYEQITKNKDRHHDQEEKEYYRA